MEITFSSIPLVLRVNCRLHPAHGVESSAARFSTARFLELLNSGFWDALQVAAARILACLLLIVMWARFCVQPVVELLQDLESLVKGLFCIDKVDYVGLVCCILKTTSLNLVSLVLAILRE